MNAHKIISLKEKLDRAYSLLSALADDKSQSGTVQIISRDARNYVSGAWIEMDAMLDRKVLK